MSQALSRPLSEKFKIDRSNGVLMKASQAIIHSTPVVIRELYTQPSLLTRISPPWTNGSPSMNIHTNPFLSLHLSPFFLLHRTVLREMISLTWDICQGRCRSVQMPQASIRIFYDWMQIKVVQHHLKPFNHSNLICWKDERQMYSWSIGNLVTRFFTLIRAGALNRLIFADNVKTMVMMRRMRSVEVEEVVSVFPHCWNLLQWILTYQMYICRLNRSDQIRTETKGCRHLASTVKSKHCPAKDSSAKEIIVITITSFIVLKIDVSLLDQLDGTFHTLLSSMQKVARTPFHQGLLSLVDVIFSPTLIKVDIWLVPIYCQTRSVPVSLK